MLVCQKLSGARRAHRYMFKGKQMIMILIIVPPLSVKTGTDGEALSGVPHDRDQEMMEDNQGEWEAVQTPPKIDRVDREQRICVDDVVMIWLLRDYLLAQRGRD